MTDREPFLVVGIDDGRLTIRSLRGGEDHSYAPDDWFEEEGHELTDGDIVGVQTDDSIAICKKADASVEHRAVTRWKKRRLHIEGFESTFSAEEASAALAVDESVLSSLVDRTVTVVKFHEPSEESPETGTWRLTAVPRGVVAELERAFAEKARVEAEEKAAARERSEARRRKEAREEAWDDPERFVNPYTFVPAPAPEGMVRGTPAGHHHMPSGHLSGSINVTWQAETPILHRSPSGTEGKYMFPRHHGELALPGSSIKGAIRSMHETLFGGCMRVLDLDLVSSHREQAKVAVAKRKLAIVESDSADRKVTVRLCNETVWVHLDVLKAALGGADKIRTGARLDIDASKSRHRKHGRKDPGREEITDPSAASAGGDWVLLTTDAGARRRGHPVYFAAGHLTDKTAQVADDVLADYRAASEGTEDERVDANQPMPVKFRGRTIAYRQPVRRDLPRGTVVWVEVGGSNKVSGLRRAQIWRIAGDHPVRERLDPAWHPCGSSPELEGLCPSCALFGSAGDEDSNADHRGVVSYRGHVRFGPAIAATASPERIELAPMGSPRPSSGQFYLEKPAMDLPTHVDGLALSYWGSDADRPEPRKINGRKYYWHGYTDDPDKPARQRRRKGQSDKMSATVEVLPTGTELSCTIRFDGISEAQLGALIASIDPERLLSPPAESEEGSESRPIRSRLGGGRPFGFGTVKVNEIRLDAQTAQQRYGTDSKAEPDTGQLVALAAEATPPPVQATWDSARAVLSVGEVNPERIWYPPAEFWDVPPRRDVTENFDKSYQFFGRTKGERQKNTEIPLVTLPKPTDTDPTLPIIERPPR